jgi:hypothetical protein
MQWLRCHLREHIKSPLAQPAAATDKTDAMSAIHQMDGRLRDWRW